MDIFAADEIASGVRPSTEQLMSPSPTLSLSDFKAEVSQTFLPIDLISILEYRSFGPSLKSVSGCAGCC